uniref:hypothetical protein n=1 Tax=Streptomyces sp. HSW2009 TaxID=3142890 RepID=UPI0032ECF154
MSPLLPLQLLLLTLLSLVRVLLFLLLFSPLLLLLLLLLVVCASAAGPRGVWPVPRTAVVRVLRRRTGGARGRCLRYG